MNAHVSGFLCTSAASIQSVWHELFARERQLTPDLTNHSVFQPAAGYPYRNQGHIAVDALQ